MVSSMVRSFRKMLSIVSTLVMDVHCIGRSVKANDVDTRSICSLAVDLGFVGWGGIWFFGYVGRSFGPIFTKLWLWVSIEVTEWCSSEKVDSDYF